MRRGVDVFTRRNLHSKLVVGDDFAIAGSANVSSRSYQLLDEAAILTNDAVAIRRRREYINRLCTEPIRPKYLEQCKEAYRPPHIANAAGGGGNQSRGKHAKLWVVSLREKFSLPEG
jgi:phosphatidylserine/phosphatidylglycerophosphate/cardiolipin synthase-like enzyme